MPDISKSLTNLGKQTIKRTANVLTHQGFSSAAKEASKAAAYFIKNAKYIALPLLVSLRDAGIAALVGTTAKNLYLPFDSRRYE